MAKLKENFEEFATCLSMVIGAAELFVGFFNLQLLMDVRAISFALPFHFSQLFG